MSSPHTPTPSGTIPAQGQSKARPASEAFSPSPLTDIETPTSHSNAGPFGRAESPSEGRQLRPRKSVKSSHSDTATGSQGDALEDMYMSVDGWESEPDVRAEDVEEEEEDDPVDLDFIVEEPNTRKELSPKKRNPVGFSVKSEAKVLVRAIDPNKGRCILTGMTEPKISNQFAHVIARATKADTLTRLEYHWGRGYFTLYIDTRFNITQVHVGWHKPMDSGLWGLVPHHTAITKVKNWVLKKSENKNGNISQISQLWKAPKTKPELKAKSDPKAKPEHPVIQIHTYYMLPLDDSLETVPLYRLVGAFDPQTPEQRHIYPYKTLGPLSSHIQPHFAIYAIGAKLAKIEKLKGTEFNDWFEKLAENASFGHKRNETRGNMQSLLDIQFIYRRWASNQGLPAKADSWYTVPK